MQTLMPWIAVAVTIVAGWALIKRYQTHMVLLFAGLVLLLCAAGLTDASFLPKGVKPSGFFLFDIFNTLKSIATKQSAGIGFLIMTAGGFAAYMDRIGAARALVDIAVKPLSMLKAPYLVLVGGYLVGQILVMVIPSAAGLAMLLLVALFPILKGGHLGRIGRGRHRHLRRHDLRADGGHRQPRRQGREPRPDHLPRAVPARPCHSDAHRRVHRALLRAAPL